MPSISSSSMGTPRGPWHVGAALLRWEYTLSDEGLRCPIVPVEQKRRAVRFVRFSDENHELARSGKPTHRLQRFGHILDWFAKKLVTRAEVASEAAS